jgi:hypothetical protein
MGRTGPAAPPYRDDPDAVSLHTTPDDYDYDAPEISGLPPSYADSELGSAAPTVPILRHVPPPSSRTDHNKTVRMSRGKPQVCETQTVFDSRYDSDPVYLEEGIRELAKHAPNPLVYIMGHHKETVRRGDKKETKEITDFRIVLDMQRYLRPNFDDSDLSSMSLVTVENGEKTHRGTAL